MRTIPLDDHCAVLDEIYHMALAPSVRPYSMKLIRRIERALADAGHIEDYKPKRQWLRFFGGGFSRKLSGR